MHVWGCLNIWLETSEKHCFSNFVYCWVVYCERVLFGFHVRLGTVQPTVDEWTPPDIGLVDEKDTASWDGSWTGVLQVWNFEQKSHWRSEWDSIIWNQCKHLVIVHDSIQWFNPKSINITVQNCPFMNVSFLILLLAFILVFQNDWQDTVSPFLWFSVMTEQFIYIDSFWIQSINLTILTEFLERLK